MYDELVRVSVGGALRGGVTGGVPSSPTLTSPAPPAPPRSAVRSYGRNAPCIVFCETKKECNEMALNPVFKGQVRAGRAGAGRLGMCAPGARMLAHRGG